MNRLSVNTKFRLFFILVALIVTLVMLLSFRFGETDNYPTKYSLYVALYDATNTKQLRQDIMKYTFDNGVKTGEEKVMSVFGKKEGGPMTDYIRIDDDNNKILRNRFLISGSGNVIDLKNKVVLSDEKAKLVRVSSDSVIFYVNDIFKGKYFSLLKMNEGKFEKISDPMFNAIVGQDIGVDYETQNRRIWYYPPKAEKKLLVHDAGFGEEILDNKKTAVIPIYWIDSWNFIFPYYPVTKNKATIIEVNVKTGAQTKLGDITDMPKGNEASYFKLDPDNNLLYVCPKGNEIIDIKNKTIKTLDFYHCGNKFDVQVVADAKGRSVKFKGQEIGKYICELSSVEDCKSAVALEKKMKIENEVYSQGIGVWTVQSKKWITINVDNVASVIGWVEE